MHSCFRLLYICCCPEINQKSSVHGVCGHNSGLEMNGWSTRVFLLGHMQCNLVVGHGYCPERNLFSQVTHLQYFSQLLSWLWQLVVLIDCSGCDTQTRLNPPGFVFLVEMARDITWESWMAWLLKRRSFWSILGTSNPSSAIDYCMFWREMNVGTAFSVFVGAEVLLIDQWLGASPAPLVGVEGDKCIGIGDCCPNTRHRTGGWAALGLRPWQTDLLTWPNPTKGNDAW